MATRTRSDLVLAVLGNLGVLATGQTPSIEDTENVDSQLPSLMAEFGAREVVYVPDLNNIPLAWFFALADMVAYECKDTFGIMGEDAQSLKDKNDESIIKFRIMLRGRPTYATVQGTFI